MSKVRLVFAGTGWMGQIAHLQNYVALKDECEVVAVADVRESVAQQVANRYGVPKAYKDMYEMLDKEEYDGIVCIQNFSRHEDLLPNILSIGKPVMLEKPIALNVEVGQMLADVAHKHNTNVMVGYHKRSDPAMEYAKKVIDQFKASGEYGPYNEVRVLMADGNWTYCGMIPNVINSDEVPPAANVEKPSPILNAEQQGYHGHIVNYYVHQINYMRHLMGEPYEVEYVSKNGVLMVAKGKVTGVTGVLEMGPYASSPVWDEGATAMFDSAYVKVDLPAPLTKLPGKVHIRTPQGITTPLMEANYAMLNQAKNFVKVVTGEAAPVTTIDEAVEDLRIAINLVKMKYDIK